jgi:hypothetical protein
MLWPAPSRRQFPVLVLGALLGCSSSKTIAPNPETSDPEIVRSSPGEPLLKSIPGPLASFDSYTEALFAACRKVFTKPRSSAGRRPPGTALREEQDAFKLRRQVSTEYCAWMYYTPDNKYTISLLTDYSKPDPTGTTKRCFLPDVVKDSRYPPESIQYIVVLHNHTFDTPLSDYDVSWIVSQGKIHGFEPKSKNGNPRLSVVAFFSNAHDKPTCDGFYMYTPYTGKILKWTRDDKQWACSQTHVVKWLAGDSLETPKILEEEGPCPNTGAP